MNSAQNPINTPATLSWQQVKRTTKASPEVPWRVFAFSGFAGVGDPAYSGYSSLRSRILMVI